ncbi:unnamed protein product [Lymnaea stagnalis]|uniref:G-protein coupled receptors family 1 profile domain-containing protein n=1 Tax=Lymnaea stagnalis TaxID=6523 RepID=A0AAV2HLR2_LYMST
MSSMAISDALLAVLVMPLGITEVINNGKWVLGFRTCIVKYCLDYLLSGVPCFHVFCMALDRYIAVCHPLRYRLLSHKHAYVMICLSWMIPCLFLMSWIVIGVHEFDDCMKLTNACSLFNFKTEFIIAFVFTYVVPFFVMYFLYLLIIRKLGKIKKPLGLRMKCRISKQADTQLCFESVVAINRNTKAFRTIGLVMICFTICWLPSWIWLFVFLVRRSPTPSWFTVCVSWFAYLNSTLNPVLYCCNRSVRMAVRSVMCPSSVTK